MARLGQRVRALAVDAGVEVLDRAEHRAVELSNGRPTAVEVDVPGDRGTHRVRLAAPLFVDASGRRGVLRRQVPALAPWCPTVRGDELCTAADVHLDVVDPDGARRFLARHGAQPGETVTAVGTNGGFSTVAVGVADDLAHARVLVGCLANGRYGTGPRMLDDLRRREAWLGEVTSGGSGVIPLRRPYARFTAPGIALVGDAACQVFPAHGSGIGLGLIAGTMLAEAVAGADDPGDDQALWRYQAGFQREHGGTLAAYDVVRRLSSRLGTRGVTEMFRSGLVGPDSSAAALRQQWWSPAPSELPRLGVGLATRPGLAAKVLPALARASAAHRLYEQYPTEPDDAALRSWSRRADSVLGRAAI
jgi:flavin-dependent dehydrogenase